MAPQRVRFVTHAGIGDDDVDYVADVLDAFHSVVTLIRPRESDAIYRGSLRCEG